MWWHEARHASHPNTPIPDIRPRRTRPTAWSDNISQLGRSLAAHERANLLVSFRYDNPGFQTVQSKRYRTVKARVTDAVRAELRSGKSTSKSTPPVPAHYAISHSHHNHRADARVWIPLTAGHRRRKTPVVRDIGSRERRRACDYVPP